jgi:CBS-domain-containing membrane protein
MLTGHFHRMPVVGPGGEVVGMVTQPDLLRAVFLEWQGGAATAG